MSDVLDDDLAMVHTTAPCRGCGAPRVLCAFGQCTTCHQPRRAQVWRGEAWTQPVELCCGWWGPLTVLPWTCLTCGTLRRRHG
jgi:hypothetical protein